MKIKELLARDQITFSCEIFPPRKEDGFPGVLRVADEICALGPDFVSVTYGAGGSGAKGTVEVASHLQNRAHITALAHVTCVGSTREEIAARLRELKEQGVENILALRGDLPQDAPADLPRDYAHAADLVRAVKKAGDFCVGGACYPEGHTECVNRAADVDYLKEKVEAGCDFLTTQMFFDNNLYYNFLYRTLSAGITVPIIPGIMPVINARQIKRSAELSGAAFPARFRAIVDRFADEPLAMEQAGVAYATDQIIDLIANGVRYIHLYTMNRPETAAKILRNLSHILR